MMRAPMTLSVGTLLSATGLRPTGHGPKSSDKPVTIIGISVKTLGPATQTSR